MHNTVFRQHLQHIDVRHCPTVPPLNQFLSFCYSVSWPVLVGVMVASFAAVAVPFALSVWGSDCADDRSFGTTYVLALAHLVSFGEEGSVRDSGKAGCVLLTTAFSLVALVMQAAIFALCVTRFLNPRIELAIPTRPCVVRRDGQWHLSLRIMHPQGHLVSSVSMHATWIHRRVSQEGERHMKVDVINFNDDVHRHVWMPMTFLHRLGGDSPLAEYAEDVTKAPGYLSVFVQGFDEVLKCSFCNRAIYYMDRVAYGKWRDVVVSVNFAGQKAKPETRRALLRKWRPGHLAHDKVVDLQYFDEVEGVADAPREEGGASGRGRAQARSSKEQGGTREAGSARRG